MKKILLLTTVLILSACTDSDGAKNALENMSLEPVKIGGYSWFGCSDKDWFSTKFTARNKDGKIVKGQVCSGWFKGATVRFN